MKKRILVSMLAGLTAIAFGQGQLSASVNGTKAGTLYERLGGIQKIAAFVDWCVDMESKDPILSGNERFKMSCQQAGLPAIKFAVTSFLAAKTGGMQKPAMDVAAVSKWFMPTPEQNEQAWRIRMEAMTKAGVPMDEQKELRQWFENEVWKSTATMPEPEKLMKKDSLYARLGGIAPISMVVDEFVNRLSMDETIQSNPKVIKALSEGHVTAAGLKFLVTEQLAAASGGPYKYSGRDMATAHKGLMISEKEWQAGAAILKKVLEDFKVPAKEQNEIFTIVSSTRKDIVGK